MFLPVIFFRSTNMGRIRYARRVLDLVETLENRLACYDLLTRQPIEPRNG